MSDQLIIIKQASPGGGTGAVDSVNGMTGVVVVNKTHVGLGNVNNTSDVDKPVSTAQSTAISLASSVAASVDASLSSAVSVEVSTRVLEGATLSTALSSEVVARASADTSLTSRISTEESVRASLTISTDARIYAWETAFTALESRVSDVEFEVATVSTAVSAETSSRVSADASLASALGAEATARVSVDASLSTAIAGAGGTPPYGYDALRCLKDFRPGASGWLVGEPVWHRINSTVPTPSGTIGSGSLTTSGVTGTTEGSRVYENNENFPYGEEVMSAAASTTSYHAIASNNCSNQVRAGSVRLSRFVFRLTRSLGDASNTGFIRLGSHRVTSATDPTNAVWIYYASGTADIVLKSRANGSITTMVLKAAVLDEDNDIVIEENVSGGYIRAWADGVLVGDITTNLPGATVAVVPGVQLYCTTFASAANSLQVKIFKVLTLFNILGT